MSLFDFAGGARGDGYKPELTASNGYESKTTDSWDSLNKFVEDSKASGLEVTVDKPDSGFFGFFK